MLTDKQIGAVYETTNFDQFKCLDGNRNVDIPANLFNSIRDAGYKGAPIVVNEFMETIDGQTRLEICKQLNIPVQYTIVPGLRIEDCVRLNATAHNWQLIDYIRSYAKRGFVNYIELLKLLEEYVEKNKITARVVITVYQGYMSSTNNKSITEGKLDRIGESEARKILEFLKCFDTTRVHGSRSNLYSGLKALYHMDKIDNSILIRQYDKYGREISGITDIADAVRQLEYVYNKNRKKTYIVDEYRKMANDRCAAIPGGGHSSLHSAT
jgi:hypothetical protein